MIEMTATAEEKDIKSYLFVKIVVARIINLKSFIASSVAKTASTNTLLDTSCENVKKLSNFGKISKINKRLCTIATLKKYQKSSH